MECNNSVLPNEGMQSGPNELGQMFHGVHSLHTPYSAAGPPQFWGPPPPLPPQIPPQFPGFGPRTAFPFPFRHVPPMFNIPPPPLNVSSGSKMDEDGDWLKNWIQSRPFKKPHNVPTVKSASICDTRDKLKLWLRCLTDLQEKHSILHDGVETLSETEWSALCADVKKTTSDISEISSSLTEKPLHDLQQKLSKQIKKRSRQKRQISKQREDAYVAQIRRQNLHQKANAWLADMQLKVDRVRKNEELKREADAVLAEVTHRQSEGKRQIALLEALQKLHQSRVQAMEARGSKLSAEDKTSCQHSNSTICELLTLWTRKMEEYAKEEQGLRVMLEESAAKKSDLEIQNAQKVLREWETCLFGSESSFTMDGPYDTSTLVSIRYAWDQYIVPEGVAVPMASTMPVGWVLPTTPSSPDWQQLLSNK